MTALIIIAAVFLLVVLLLLLPVSVYIRFHDDFFLKIRIAGIKVYEIEPGKDIKKPEPADRESDKQAEKNEEKLFEHLKKKLGFTGAVKEITAFVKALLRRIGKTVLSHMTFKKLMLSITVADEDAAMTALQYGALCTAVYPVLSFICANARVRMKHINIYSDFESGKPDIDFSCSIFTRPVFMISVFFGAFKEYNKFKTRNEL